MERSCCDYDFNRRGLMTVFFERAPVNLDIGMVLEAVPRCFDEVRVCLDAINGATEWCKALGCSTWATSYLQKSR